MILLNVLIVCVLVLLKLFIVVVLVGLIGEVSWLLSSIIFVFGGMVILFKMMVGGGLVWCMMGVVVVDVL